MVASEKRRRLLQAALAAGMAPAVVRAQQKIELRISHYVPAVHGLQTQFIEPWAKEIEKRTNGQVTYRISAAGSPLGRAENQLDQVQNGVVDIAFGLSGNPRGRLPRSLIVEMPFLIEGAGQGSRTLMELYPKFLREEYKGIKVLCLLTHNAGHIHTRDKKVERFEDLQGLRVRTPSATVSAMLVQMGAVPVGMPPGNAYEALQKGTLDGACFPWDPVRAFKIDEVTKFHTDSKFYTAAFWYGMNQKRYDSLPADVKKVVDDVSGEYLVSRMQGWWDGWDKAGREAAMARNNTIVVLSEAERKRWADALAGVYNKQMIELESQGVKNARDIYIEMQRTAAKYRGKGMTAAAARPLPLKLVAAADTVTRYAAWFAMALLFGAILVTVVDVSTRRTIGWSVPGLVDITQLFVMSFVYFSIPFGFMREANVSVDFVTDRLPPRGLELVKGICALLGAGFMAGITYYSWIRAAQQIENGEVSQTIGIPFAWYWVPLLAGGALSTVAALLQTWRHLWAAATGHR